MGFNLSATPNASDAAASSTPKPRKTSKPRKCTCPAYNWPHRTGGGNCRFPDPPIAVCPTKAGTHAGRLIRPGSAIRQRLMQRYNLHPIRHRAKVKRFLPKLYFAYCRRRGMSFWPYKWIGGWLPAMRITEHGAPPDLTPIDEPGVWAALAHPTSRKWSYSTSPAVSRKR